MISWIIYIQHVLVWWMLVLGNVLNLTEYSVEQNYIHVYRKEPAFALMSYLATAGDIDFSMHFKPAESGALTKSLDKEIHNIERNMQKRQKMHLLSQN